MITLVSFVAFAGVTTDTINTGPSLARITITFVDIYLAIFPRNTLYAKTLVSEIYIFKKLSEYFLFPFFSHNTMLTRSHSRN